MTLRSILLIVLISAGIHSSSAQDFSRLNEISLKNKTNCANAENQVIQCCNYLMSGPVELLKNDLNHLNALQFLMRWMKATPDYAFDIDHSMVKATQGDKFLLGIFLASMTKYVLENKGRTIDKNDVKYHAFLGFLTYCENDLNHVKKSRYLKKLIKAQRNNHLKASLNIK